MSKLKFLTVSEVAKMFGVVPTTITARIRKGIIKGAVKVTPQFWLIPESSLEDIEIMYQKARTSKPKD